MFTIGDFEDRGAGNAPTAIHDTDIKTDLIDVFKGRPYYILKTNANLTSASDIQKASADGGAYEWRGFTKPHQRELISKMSVDDLILVVHSQPIAKAGAHAIVKVAGDPAHYYDRQTRKNATMVSVRFVRYLSRVIYLSELRAIGASMCIGIFDPAKKVLAEKIYEDQFFRILGLEQKASGEASP